MQVRTHPTAHPVAGGVDPWLLITGGSVGLVVGMAAELLRMGLHRARAALHAHRAEHCPGGCG
ncbi:MAG: hypothetical protein J0M00_25085 [Burkholderiales bacterium]|nr:hypothetical protein [Burkholderiales bacterium]